MGKEEKQIIVYQTSSGSVEVSLDVKQETILLTQQQVGQLFDVQKAAVSKHVKNIFDTGELSKKSTVSILETVQAEGKRKVSRKVEYYNLDLVLSIGYRVNSTNATRFRQWATKTLREHIVKGYTINRKRISKNYNSFMQAVENVKILLPANTQIDNADILELIKTFANTWFSLDAYDKGKFTISKPTKSKILLVADDLKNGIAKLKIELLKKNEASELFAIEKDKDSLRGIIGNVSQSFDGKDLYPSIEEKAAHLLYFIVKNHPFTDGNKRSGAFAFVWFLRRTGRLNLFQITPQALTAITLLIAESNPKDKEKMIGLVTILLGRGTK
ncbi:MAG: death-on-curing protein [Candidatus Levybacteria bacterium CG_4_9_14_3_um_filter_35_16]|nr:MAG: death-on-curing protein [Candidatus Levybacteria bacterium CG22_combo_CG10-13_8_21_14_all_35_11]PIZ97923.1 MAG: death-on-curing protein [Candidatus Levybacteria bacterium CG_4_10_14_0_2_um_filter_35_8]PJA90875.1 MAG: death-on-curing protein [Candidatus Levybacteria bacterium CG_4_9_14_3_um_filter_35_16]PJC54709.1 MAG: death-on-curing protein [Candidatus Levybacteria bacterium CG_4_9_14_0_2_um_filter_35_21]